MVSELIDKYLFLIRIIGESGDRGLRLEQISDRWEGRYSAEYPRRTFNNHREAIADIFGIEIACRRGDNVYYIPQGMDAIDSDRTRSWLVDTFTVNSLLTLGRERLSGRVSVERIPSGQNHLAPIMSAMLSDRILEITYKKYTGNQSETLHVEPYAVKEEQKRWYLVGFCREREAIRVYGLDRIGSVTETDSSFRMPKGFDIDRLFSESFGMYLADEGQAELIRFRTDVTQAKYLRDLPLHSSQTETGTDSDGMVNFAIRVAVNEALLMELTRLGAKIEVLSPESLRFKMKEIFENATKLYK